MLSIAVPQPRFESRHRQYFNRKIYLSIVIQKRRNKEKEARKGPFKKSRKLDFEFNVTVLINCRRNNQGERLDILKPLFSLGRKITNIFTNMFPNQHSIEITFLAKSMRI